MSHHRIILASSSSYRQALLAQLGLKFETQTPDTDETPFEHETAALLVARLAENKAKCVAQDNKDAIVIGSDQVCSIDGEILGKPGSTDKAIEQLSRLSGRKVRFETGLCLIWKQRQQLIVESFDVYFRTLSVEQIHRYITQEMPLDCAGSFKSEGLGIVLFHKFDGRDPNTLIGLPLMALTDMLANWNIELPL